MATTGTETRQNGRRRRMRDERGQAMAEFALVLPILIIIVVGLLGFGRVLFYWIQANHAANETARWAIVDRNPFAPGQTLPQIRAKRCDDRVQQRERVHRLPRKDLDDGGIGDPVA